MILGAGAGEQGPERNLIASVSSDQAVPKRMSTAVLSVNTALFLFKLVQILFKSDRSGS